MSRITHAAQIDLRFGDALRVTAFLEIGIDQGPAARALLMGVDVAAAHVEQDFTRRDRYLVGRR